MIRKKNPVEELINMSSTVGLLYNRGRCDAEFVAWSSIIIVLNKGEVEDSDEDKKV